MAMNSLSVLGGNFATKGELDLAGGLVHINTTTFSAVSSVSLNNVFTSDYDNYRVILTGAGSGSLIVTARLRVGGTDNTGANFDRQRLYINGSGVTATRYNSQTDFALGGFDTPDRGLITFDVFRPFLTTSTLFNAMNSWPASGSDPVMFIGVGSNSLTTSFDGFTLIASAGTITGTIRVYGYKNS